ncbi:hypothetical protein JCM33374_g5713 [Metschnikowia sp. JCM 33374]|nr:hypothetical protein JCM33374_g5713 [Metschnikowia sp. JCM 33374]
MSKPVAELEPKQAPTTNTDLPITQEPKPTSMDMSRGSQDDRDTIQTYDDDASGYQRETNECSEFCIDLFSCFGACDVCCPSTGEGCLSTTAAFLGGLCVGCLKC